MNELQKLREEIDRIDDELLRLMSTRAQLAQRVGKSKEGNTLYRPEREAQVLRRVDAANPGPLPAAAVRVIFREIMSACLALEQPLTVAYLGPAGTFTESAALRHFGAAPHFSPSASIDDVFRTVEVGNAQYGVVPVENSTEGAVGRTLDLLLQSPLMVCGEVMLPVHQNLLAATDSTINIKKIYSHAQSFAQCHEWLNHHLPAVERISVVSNAEAARAAAAEPATTAAIASTAAAALYQLNIIAANIEDNPDNTTRFIVLAQHDAGCSGQDRTSLVCSAQNRAGAVHDLLTPLKVHGVSMSKFESRPARGFGGSRWEYVFFIDLEGHRTEINVAAALDELRAQAGFLKVLGSYPRT